MGVEVLDDAARWIRAAPRNERGRVEVLDTITGKPAWRLPVDALDGVRRGLFAKPSAAPAASAEPTVQERVQAGAKR